MTRRRNVGILLHRRHHALQCDSTRDFSAEMSPHPVRDREYQQSGICERSILVVLSLLAPIGRHCEAQTHSVPQERSVESRLY